MTVLYATQAYAALGDRIAGLAGYARGELDTRVFADGERYFRLRTSPTNQPVAIVGGTVSEADTLELYDLACGAVEGGARSLTMVIPYYGYQTMERQIRSHEVVTAKTRARLLSSIPIPGAGSRVLLLDLHTDGIPYYFEGSLRPVHLSARDVVLPAVKRLAGKEPYALGCADAGRAKWVERFANELGVTPAFVFKRRHEGGTEVTAVSAHVQGRRVIIYDDLIRTGGSLIGAARAFKEAGASSVAAVATHGVLPGDALERLARSGLFERLAVTDSHPRAAELAGSFLTVESVAPVFAAYLEENPCS